MCLAPHPTPLKLYAHVVLSRLWFSGFVSLLIASWAGLLGEAGLMMDKEERDSWIRETLLGFRQCSVALSPSFIVNLVAKEKYWEDF